MQNAVRRGFFCFSVFGLSFQVWIFIAHFYKNWSLLEGIFHFVLYLKGYLDFFFKNGLSSSLFYKIQREVFARWSGDLLHRDDYERLKWPRKKYFCLRKISELCPRKFIVNPRKKSKRSGREIQKWARKLPKKREKVGEKANFCPRKKPK